MNDWITWAVVTATVAAFGALAWLGVEQSQEWERFKADHHCRAVAHISGDVFNTFGMDAKGRPVVGIGTTPSKTGWQCDDGVTYYR